MQSNLIYTFSGHIDAIYSLCKLAKSGEFLSAGADGRLILWHEQKPEEGLLLAKTDTPIYKIVIQNRFAILATRSGQLIIIDIYLKETIKVWQLSKDALFSLFLDKDNHLYVGSAMGDLWKINLEKLAIMQHSIISKKPIRTITATQNFLFTGQSDNLIQAIHKESLQVINQIKGHSSSVFAALISPSERFLLSGGRDATLRAWDIENNFELVANIPAHWYTINQIALSPDGNMFASASRDKTIKIWDLASLNLLCVLAKTPLELGHTHSVNCLLWLNNKTLLSAGDDRQVNLWQLSI